MYHGILDRPDPYAIAGISLSMFTAQVVMLSRFGSVLALDDILDRVSRGEPLPRRCVALTFDDGYGSVHSLGAPLLRRYHLPATCYVSVQGIERGVLWPDLLRWLLRVTSTTRVELDTLPGDAPRVFQWRTIAERVAVIRALETRLKSTPDRAKWRVLDELGWKLLGGAFERAAAPRVMLSWDELGALAHDGFAIGGHTTTHPILTRVSEAEARSEIVGCRERLERALGVPVKHFAYPNGGPGDFSPAIRRLVETAGYQTACTAIPGYNEPTGDRFALKRIDGNQGSLVRLVRLMASG
jgi:peptidoglycan/xylan/chitin deacetylase (PgdA/CDA1 family)